MTSLKTIFTVGHSNLRLNEFIDLLEQQKIRTVIDVRSQPYSKYCPYFNKRELDTALTAAGFTYMYKGNLLGGIPDDDRYYDDDGHVDYSLIAEEKSFQEALDHVCTLAREDNLTLMCGEENPTNCHRRNLLSKELIKLNFAIIHIRKGGELQADHALDSEVIDKSEETETKQLSLFDSI